MVDRAINALIAILLAIIGLGIVLVALGFDPTVVSNLMAGAVEFIVPLAMVAIVAAVFISLGKGLLNGI